MNGAGDLALVWFRQDLRLTDHRPLQAALDHHRCIVFVYVHDPVHDEELRWGFKRMGLYRRHFTIDSLAGLHSSLVAHDQILWITEGDAPKKIAELAYALAATNVYCEEIAAPEEEAQVTELVTLGAAMGFGVTTLWQSSLLEPQDLPFAVQALPQVFSEFRRRIERAKVTPPPPIPTPAELPKWPASLGPSLLAFGWAPSEQEHAARVFSVADEVRTCDPRSSFPFFEPRYQGGERAALAHLEEYFASDLPQRYKQTRNGLQGTGYSTKLSPWLAVGALSPRVIWQALQRHEDRFGANESTYWIGFELWWRDYFRFLHQQHGHRLFRARGLSERVTPDFSQPDFDRWRFGRTGVDFIDAGMRELAGTGYLSNRLRQNVASFWVNDLNGDWRAGAAWFEYCLIDYDVYSNHGNWLYLAGRGTDPRAGRRFDPDKQARDYDGDKTYRCLWLS